MADLFIYNSLSRKKEKFTPLKGTEVGMYSCGPTVYDYTHIGHLRRYVGDDILIRVLKLNGYSVKHVMNITDVGHLTSDADSGEDKIEKAAKEKGQSAWDIAKNFEEQFFSSIAALNIEKPDIVCRATEHIPEQIKLIETLEQKGLTYKTEDGVYFDTLKFPGYGSLGGGTEGIKPGARVDVAGKKSPTDFALWKFSPKDSKRQMEWESPWGVGFPGWHIECSAMSMKYLGESFDIHTGGVDHISIHHTNEIAQAEGATGKPFVRFWVHHEFLMVDGRKMAKSLGNIFTVKDITDKGYDPIALRYLYLNAHYKDPENFTWEALKGAETSLNNLREQLSALRGENQRTALSEEKEGKIESSREKFRASLNDDLNTPKALAVVWETLKSSIPSSDKYDLVLYFDEVLGLGLSEIKDKETKVPDKIIKLMEKRETLREQGDFSGADKARDEVEKEGYLLQDTPDGPKVKKI